jgi:hypothetical protein
MKNNKQLEDELVKRTLNFDPNTATVFTNKMSQEEILAKFDLMVNHSKEYYEQRKPDNRN